MRSCAVALIVLLAGCSSGSDEQPAAVANTGFGADDAPAPAPTPEEASDLLANDAAPTDTVVPADSPRAAVEVVRRYFGWIANRRYGQAWALWDNGGEASGMSQQAFGDSFARYAEYRADIGTPGRIDAGAGQRYITVPVRISGTLRDTGEPFALEGPVTLHHVGEIDGASPEQKLWRIRETALKPRPVPAIPETASATYRCDGAVTATVRFDNRADTASVRFDGGPTMVLQGQKPASGMWYSDGLYELRGKGREATLKRPEAEPLSCTAVD